MDILLVLAESLDEILQLTIGGVSWYSYRKRIRKNYKRIRAEIVKLVFEEVKNSNNLTQERIEAIIKAKLRDEDLREDAFSLEEIIEDVIKGVSETVYLNFEEKDELYERIKSLSGQIYFGNAREVVSELPEGKKKDQLLTIVNSDQINSQELRIINDVGRKKWKSRESYLQRERKSSKVFQYTSIALFSFIILFGLFLVPIIYGKDIYEIDREYTFFDFLVVLIGVVATLISIGSSSLAFRKQNRKFDESDIEDIEFEDISNQVNIEP